jgi:fructose-1-phosphate kinase PfkB-like protein
LRLGVATAASTLMKPGTAECDRHEVERLMREVSVMPFDGALTGIMPPQQ